MLCLFVRRHVREHRLCSHVHRLEQKQYSDRLFATWLALRFEIRRENQVDSIILTVEAMARFHGGP